LTIVNDMLVTFGLRQPEPRPEPTPAEIASKQLAQTERDILSVEARKEEVYAELDMLRVRKARLKSTLKQISEEQS
jgi:hypothetical protein